MTSVTGFWYLPARVRCLRIDAETRETLRGLARGRALCIDLLPPVNWRGLRAADAVVRWLDGSEALPDHLLLVEDIDDPVAFVRAELAPFMAREQARLKVCGPRWLGRFRQLRIDLEDSGSWLELFEACAGPFGMPR